MRQLQQKGGSGYKSTVSIGRDPVSIAKWEKEATLEPANWGVVYPKRATSSPLHQRS